jgi:signal peptidase II
MKADADGVEAATASINSAAATGGRRPFGVPLVTAALVPIVVGIDQLTKRWAVTEIAGHPPRHVVWTLQWNVTYNSGMAFSQAQGIGPVIGIVALVVVLWMAWSSRKLTSKLTAVAAGLIAGGALGNLADRLFRGRSFLNGAVVDFIDLQWFPIFNVADMAIDVGGALFVIWTLATRRAGRTT